jgi:hypothetical protein
MSRIEYRTSLRGFTEYRKTNRGTEITMIHKYFCNGEAIFKEITANNLESETYLLSATVINSNIVQLTIYRLTVEHGAIRLEEFNIREWEISEDLLNAIDQMYDIAINGNPDHDVTYDENNVCAYVDDDDYTSPDNNDDDDSCYDDDD